MPTPGTVLACFYAGDTLPDRIVRAVTRRPGQPIEDVPSHCALIVPRKDAIVVFPPPGEDYPGWEIDWQEESDLYEMVAKGWVKRGPTQRDLYGRVYEVALPDIDACRRWCETNAGRYRWWVDGVIGLMALRLVRHRRVGPIIQGHWHLAYRHICSVDMLRSMTAGGWSCPHWLAVQDCPASPNDLLFAVRET